jgi:hypothetical protein
MSPNYRSRIFDRRARVTVGDFAISNDLRSDTGNEGILNGLRIGFTVEKDLLRHPNVAEVVVYNLSRASRERLHRERATPVVIEAGYAATGLVLIFAGEMREAFSRPESDGTWATILRAGDGDTALRQDRRATGLRPGVSIERVAADLFKDIKVGAGNLWGELEKQVGDADFDADRLNEAFTKGFNGSGSVAAQMEKVLKSAGLEMSVQDGQIQILGAGDVLGTDALILSPDTGLEGSPEVDHQGTMHCRVRIVPGLSPGYPVQVTTYRRRDLETFGELGVSPLDDYTLYRIEKTRFVGDTHGADWTAEIDCRDAKLPPKTKKKKKGASDASP